MDNNLLKVSRMLDIIILKNLESQAEALDKRDMNEIRCCFARDEVLCKVQQYVFSLQEKESIA